jgi:GT2 family glycosyltransferase
MSIDVSVIIVNHFHSSLLHKNISSIISKTKNISYEIILINNTIEDNGIPKLIKSFPNVIFINNQSHKGFSENNNIGIKRSIGEKILILNPDTYLGNNAIYILYNYLNTNIGVGLCGPKLLNTDDSLQFSCRKFPTFKSTLLRRSFLRKFVSEEKRGQDHLMSHWDHNSNIKVDWMLGACLMVDREVISKIGLFDESYFMYCEDIDISYRLKKIGLESHYVADAVVYHEHQRQSDKKLFSKSTFIHSKSMVQFLINHKYFKELFN